MMHWYREAPTAMHDVTAGKTLGLWLVLPPQLIVMVGLGITYSVTGGSALSLIYHLYTADGDTAVGLSCWILVFGGCQLCLSQVNCAPQNCCRSYLMFRFIMYC